MVALVSLAHCGALRALFGFGMLWGLGLAQGDVSEPPPLSSHPSPPGEGVLGRAGVPGGLLQSVLAERDFLLAQGGAVLPSALPDNLTPRRILAEAGRRGGALSAARKRLRPPHEPPSPSPSPHSPSPSLASLPELREVTTETLPHTGSPAQPPPTPTLTPGAEEGPPPITSTMVTTTTISDPTTGPGCSVSVSDPEGYIDSSDDPPLPMGGFLQCTYTVTVYTGYGVELQVKSVNLSEGEQLSIRGEDEGGAWLVLANETLLVEGQVIRSPTNTISVFFRTFPEGWVGTFQLHYQIFRLSCALPRRPHHGDVSVLDLHAGGTAQFRCHLGYHLQGASALTCLNASRPHWSQHEPSCRALCGGAVRNASVGRVLAPSPPLSPPGLDSSSLSCSWTLEAPPAQRLHLHLERLALGPTERLVLWSGLDSSSVVLFDSGRGGPIPFEGVISEGPAVRVQFTSDLQHPPGTFNIRYEAFERGHCYEPYLQNGNFSTSDPSYGVGAVVQFSCAPGHSLEQGPPVIECVNDRDPYWNDTEPLCKALCGGDLSGPGGVILSPNWPDPYGEGEDCSWRIHVAEDKRILLDVQLLNLSDSDMVTVLDGDEGTTRVLGQYVGGAIPFKLASSSPDLTVHFHSQPPGLLLGRGEGFVINYMEVSRNDSCSDLPEIQNGWKTTSHAALVRGARITYQCDPGYDLVGRETLLCQWDLTWSSLPPFCEKIMYCSDPGHVEHSTRTLSDSKLLVGTTIQYTCSPGFILQGGAILTCYGREPGTPVWTSRLPHCVLEESVSCENPGLPENGYQILYKRLYLPGESLTFMCYQGYELIGEIAIKCILGNPSYWSGPLPLCRANQDCFDNHALEVAEAADSSVEGGGTALAVFILVLLLSVLLGGAYVYITRCRYHSNLRLPLMYTHPYSQITVETEFDNPTYETGGDTREYEVSI
ncbi:seizure 6-like protein [Amia ocellicauda]|uniref:seizure 6-like protein n=1 Tax=Amia ocellicauda TaxID=2972642 RepID=UPI0034641BA6